MKLTFKNQSQRRFIKVITLVMTLTFLMPIISWTFDSAALTAGLPHILFHQKNIYIPAKLATIIKYERHQGPLVILIQDLHCNYEVQMNIAKLIEKLSQEQHLNLVAVEGSSQPINATEIRSFPLKKIREEVSDYFVRQGKLTGAEYCAATGKNPIRLEGIEDPGLYAENKKSVDMLLSHEALGYCYDLREALNRLKPAIYSKRLRRLDAQFEKFRLGQAPLSPYTAFLSRLARKLNMSLDAFPNLEAYLKHGPHDPKANPEALFAELDHLEDLIRTTYYTRPEEQRLDEQLKRITVIEKMLNISAAPDEVALFRAHRDQYKVQAFVDFINRHQDRERQSLPDQVLTPDLYQLDDFLKEAASFYQVADERSRAFVDNMLARMQQQNQNIALLITGGFHTDGVLKALREKGVSCLALKPRLTKQDILNPYFRLLTQKQTALEKWLSREQRKFALQSFLPMSQNPAQMPDESSLTAREKSFKRLLGLLFQIRTIVYVYMQNKTIRHLQTLVEKFLAGYADQLQDIQIRWGGIVVYQDHTMAVPFSRSGQTSLAVIGPKAVSGLVKQEERLDVPMTIGSHPIVLVAPEYIEAVTQRMAAWNGRDLDTLPLIRLIAVYLVLVFFKLSGESLKHWVTGLPWKTWGNTIKNLSIKVFWAPWHILEALANTLKNTVFQVEKGTYNPVFQRLSSRLTIPTIKLHWQWPLEILWPAVTQGMTIGGPWLHWQWPVLVMMQQHQGGRGAGASRKIIEADGEALNWEPVVDQLAQMNWLVKNKVKQAVKNLPAVDHTEERVFSLILDHLTEPNESRSFLNPSQRAVIQQQGWAYFVDHLQLWSLLAGKPKILPDAVAAMFRKRMSAQEVDDYIRIIDKYNLTPYLTTRLFKRAGPVQGLDELLSGLERKGYSGYACDDILRTRLSNAAISKNLLRKHQPHILDRDALRLELREIIGKQILAQEEQLPKKLMGLVDALQRAEMIAADEAAALKKALQTELRQRQTSLTGVLNDREKRESLRSNSDATLIHMVIGALAPTGEDKEIEPWREPKAVEKSFSDSGINKFLNHRKQLAIIYQYFKKKKLPMERSLLEAAVDTAKSAAELTALVDDGTYKEKSPPYDLLRRLILKPRPLPVLLSLYERLSAMGMSPTSIGECVAMKNGSDQRLMAILDLVEKLQIKNSAGLVEHLVKRSMGLKEIRELLVLGKQWGALDFARLLALGMNPKVKDRLHLFFVKQAERPQTAAGRRTNGDHHELLEWFNTLTPFSQNLLAMIFSRNQAGLQGLGMTESGNEVEDKVSWQRMNLVPDMKAVLTELDERQWFRSHAFADELERIPIVHRNWETLFPLILGHISQPNQAAFFNQDDISEMTNPRYRHHYIRRFKENMELWAFLNQGNHLSLLDGKTVASFLGSNLSLSELEAYVAIFQKPGDIKPTVLMKTISRHRELEKLEDVVAWVTVRWQGANERGSILGSSLTNQDLLNLKGEFEKVAGAAVMGKKVTHFQRLAEVDRLRERLSTIGSMLNGAGLVEEHALRHELTQLLDSLKHLQPPSPSQDVLSWDDLASKFSQAISKTRHVKLVVSRTIVQAITTDESPAWLKSWPQVVRDQLPLPELTKGMNLLIQLIRDPTDRDLSPDMVQTFIKGDRGPEKNYEFYLKHHESVLKTVMKMLINSSYSIEELEEIVRLLDEKLLQNDRLIQALTQTRREMQWLSAAVAAVNEVPETNRMDILQGLLDQSIDLAQVVELVNHQNLQTSRDISLLLQTLLGEAAVTKLERMIKDFFAHFDQMPSESPVRKALEALHPPLRRPFLALFLKDEAIESHMIGNEILKPAIHSLDELVQAYRGFLDELDKRKRFQTIIELSRKHNVVVDRKTLSLLLQEYFSDEENNARLWSWIFGAGLLAGVTLKLLLSPEAALTAGLVQHAHHLPELINTVMGIGFFAGMLDKDAMTSVTGTTGLKQSVTSNFVSSTKNITDEQWKRIQKIILRIAEYDQLGIMPSGTTGAFYKVGHYTYQHLHYRIGPYRLYLAYSVDAKEVILGDFLSKNDTSKTQNFFDQQLPSVYKDDNLLTMDQGKAFIRDHGLSMADQPHYSKPSVQQLPLGDLVQHYNELVQAKSLSETIAELPAIERALEIALIVLNHHPNHLKVAADKLQQQDLVGSDQREIAIQFLLILKSIQNRLVALVEEELQKPMPDWEAIAQLWEKWDFENFQSAIKADIKTKIKSKVDQAVTEGENITDYKNQFESLGDLGQIIIEFIEEQQEATTRNLHREKEPSEPLSQQSPQPKPNVPSPSRKVKENSVKRPDQQKIIEYNQFKAKMRLLRGIVSRAGQGLPISVNMMGNYGRAYKAKGPISKIVLPDMADSIGLLVAGKQDDFKTFQERLEGQKEVLKLLPRLVSVRFDINAAKVQTMIDELWGILTSMIEQDVVIEKIETDEISLLYPDVKIPESEVILTKIKGFIKGNRAVLKRGVPLIAIAGMFALDNTTADGNIEVDDIYRRLNIIVYGNDVVAARKFVKKLKIFIRNMNIFPNTQIYLNSTIKDIPSLAAVVHRLFAERPNLRSIFTGVNVLFQDQEQEEVVEALLPAMPYTVLWDGGEKRKGNTAGTAKPAKTKRKRHLSMIGAIAAAGMLLDVILYLNGVDTGRGLGTLVSVVPVGYFLMRLPLLAALGKQRSGAYGRNGFSADLMAMKQAGLTIPGWTAWNQWVNGESDLYPTILSQVVLKTTNLSWWKLVLWGGSLAHVVQQNGALRLNLPRKFSNLSQGQRIALLAHEFYHLSKMEENDRVTVISMQRSWWSGLGALWDTLVEELVAIRFDRAVSRNWKRRQQVRSVPYLASETTINDFSGRSLTASGSFLIKWLKRIEEGRGGWKVLRVIARPLLWAGWQLLGLYLAWSKGNHSQFLSSISGLEKASLILSDDWSAIKFKANQVRLEPLVTPSSSPWGSYRFDATGQLIIGVPVRVWPGKGQSVLNKLFFEMVVWRQARQAYDHAFEPVEISRNANSLRHWTSQAQKAWIGLQLSISNLLPRKLATAWETWMMQRHPMTYLTAKLSGLLNSELVKAMKEPGSEVRKAYCDFAQNPMQGGDRLFKLLLKRVEQQNATYLSGKMSPHAKDDLAASIEAFETLGLTWMPLQKSGSEGLLRSMMTRYKGVRQALELPPTSLPDVQLRKAKPRRLSVRSAA